MSLLTACLQLQPHQLDWLASISVPGHGKHLWCAGVCVRARVAGAASAPGIVRVSTSPDIVQLRNVYRSSWGREKQKPPPKGRDMRQQWAWITHRQPAVPCCGLWASARPAPAAQLGRPLCCTDPAFLNRSAAPWRFVFPQPCWHLAGWGYNPRRCSAGAGPGSGPGHFHGCKGCFTEGGGGRGRRC